jgi:hypothetical protein
MDTTSYSITLIHGTFANKEEDRDWTLPGSQAAEILCEAIGPAANVTDPFVWSGQNRHSARLRGGECLAKKLITKGPKSVGEKRVLIGHSHGGNVIMYALKALAKAGQLDLVDGVVCLATPHITVKGRNLKPGLTAIGALVGFVLAAVYAVGITVPAYNAGFELGPYLGTLFLAGFFVVFVFPIVFLSGRVHDKIEQKAKDKAAQIETPALDETPILSIKVKGDEAFRLLSTQYLLSRLANPAWNHGIALVGRAFLGVIIAGAVVAFAISFFTLIPFLPDLDVGPFFDRIGEIVGRVFALAVFGLILILAVVLILPLMFRSHRFGFGWESLVTRSCLDVGVAEMPPKCVVCTQEAISLEALEPEGLRRERLHSLYRYPKILRLVGSWIKSNI